MGNHALITGASSGIGKELAKVFAQNNYDLVLVSQNQERLEAVANELRANYSIDIRIIAKNLVSYDSAKEIYEQVSSDGIEITALVNDAGMGIGGKFTDISLERQIDIVKLNIEALISLTHMFLQPMLKQNKGEILNVGSIAGFEPGPLLAVYHASKAFVISFSQSLAEELKDTDIQISCLCPGATDTNFFKRAGIENTKVLKSDKLADPAVVAQEGFNALMNGNTIFVHSAKNKTFTFLRRVTPFSLQTKLNKKFYEESNKH